MLILDTILFILGFYLLIKGADILVEGASSIAKTYNIPDLIIGLTIVSFGTSMPELFINIFASLQGKADIAIGNIFGSNIANILLILGVASLIAKLPVQRNTILSEIPFTLAATLLVGFVANAALFGEADDMVISRYDGFFLIFFFLLFMMYIFKVARENNDMDDSYQSMPLPKSVLFVILGCVGLYFGGNWVVEGAIIYATMLGFSESFIGLTVIAIGTSLPELAASAVAAKKGNTDIAVGNVVGSNIFNLLWVLGISAIIKPLPFDLVSNSDILMIIFASTLLIFSMVLGRKYIIERWNGAVFLLIYFSYLAFLVIRG